MLKKVNTKSSVEKERIEKKVIFSDNKHELVFGVENGCFTIKGYELKGLCKHLAFESRIKGKTLEEGVVKILTNLLDYKDIV